MGTDLTLGIVRALFVGAADDAVRHDNRLGTVLTKEGEDLFGDGRVLPNVCLLREPTLQRFRFGVLGGLASRAAISCDA